MIYYFHQNYQNLLSFNDIRYNRCHVETTNDDHKEYLNIINVISGNKIFWKYYPYYHLDYIRQILEWLNPMLLKIKGVTTLSRFGMTG